MAHYRLSIVGTLGASPEVFSTGCAYVATGPPPTQGALNAWADAAMIVMSGSNAGAVWFRGNISVSSYITNVRIYYYPSVGAPATLGAISTPASASGSGATVHPPQCATVVTLQTGIPGASYRGRMYVPMLAGSIGSGLTRTDLSASTATNFASLLEVLGSTASGGLADDPAVVSAAAGAVTPVTSVRIGNVVDTQRRRRDALNETFYSAPIP